jgi:4-amino-4-deoxy-L-arabinose transferase-like glycosyltransferase
VRSLLLGTLLATLVFLSAAAYVASDASATADEVPHIAAGALYLQGDWRLNREHPPLVKLLAALALPAREPVLRLPAQLPPGDFQWQFGAEFLFGPKHATPPELLRARLPLILLNALLIACVAWLASRLGGSAAGIVAALLAATCPTWIAHASLVTTDAAATTFYVASVACASALLHAGDSRAQLMAAGGLGLALALAVATKYSMLSALGLVPLGFVLDAARLGRWQRLPALLAATTCGGLAGASLAWGLPADPAAYLRGVRLVGHNHRSDYLFYAFGELFRGREPLYFARALLVKIALPTLVLALATLGYWLASQRPPGRASSPRAPLVALMIVPPLGYYALIAARAPALGVRYILPVLPFLFVAAGCGAARLLEHGRSARWILAACAALQLWGLATALQSSPIAYFNGLFCRTGDLPPCLDDSNVDWGQALPALARYREQHFPGAALRLFYVGSSPPGAYVRAASLAQPLELLQPVPALYAISLHLFVRTPAASWVRKLEPIAVVGGAYAVYDLRHAALR